MHGHQILFHPKGDKKAWGQLLTDLALADPAAAITEVRWRRSRNSGRPWVRPQMLPQDLQAAVQRGQARQSGRPERLSDVAASALISFLGASLGADPESLCNALVTKMESVLQVSLTRSAPRTAIEPLQWAREEHATGEWSDRVRVRLRSSDEVQRLHALLHGTPVWIGAAWCTLAITNAFLPVMPAASPPGNERGRSTGRPVQP